MTIHTEPTTTEHEHGGNEGIYFAVFIVLALLTVAEVLVTYIPGLKVPLLLGLMGTKAWLVAQFYMHLRYDTRIFSWTFVIPLIIGGIITLALQPLVH